MKQLIFIFNDNINFQLIYSSLKSNLTNLLIFEFHSNHFKLINFFSIHNILNYLFIFLMILFNFNLFYFNKFDQNILVLFLIFF